MIRKLGLVCHRCGSLITDSICECSSCGIKPTKTSHIIFINNLKTTELVNTYYDDTDQLVCYESLVDLTLSKVLYHNDLTHQKLIKGVQ